MKFFLVNCVPDRMAKLTVRNGFILPKCRVIVLSLLNAVVYLSLQGRKVLGGAVCL